MTLELILSICSLMAVVVAFVWGVYVYKRQMSAQLFIEFTERFMTVMKSFSDACDGDCPINIFDHPPAQSGKITAATIRYLNLCSEEFYLHETGFLSKHIWKIWEEEIRDTLRSDLIRREWPGIRDSYRTFGAFQRYVDNELKT